MEDHDKPDGKTFAMTRDEAVAKLSEKDRIDIADLEEIERKVSARDRMLVYKLIYNDNGARWQRFDTGDPEPKTCKHVAVRWAQQIWARQGRPAEFGSGSSDETEFKRLVKWCEGKLAGPD